MQRLALSLAILTFVVIGCATNAPRALDHIKLGMDKDQVLETAQNPARTFREAMQDHWIYVYFKDDRQWLRDVIFEEGKVVKITRPQVKESWIKDLEQAKSMEEYEQKARAHQQKAGEFKSIDGEPEDEKSK